MNKLLLIALSALALLIAALILVFSAGSERFQLVENIEPQPLAIPGPNQPDALPANTLQASPSALQTVAQPGQELAPLRITNTFAAPLQLQITVQARRPGLQFSATSWRQPANTVQEIGWRWLSDVQESSWQGIVTVRAQLPPELAVKDGRRQRQTVFQPAGQLQIPVTLSTPAAERSAAAQGLLAAPELKQVGQQLQPQIAVTNLSASATLVPQGQFVLRRRGAANTRRQELTAGQTILPGAKSVLLAARPWLGLPSGRYQLTALLRWPGQEQSTTRELLIDKQGAVRPLGPSSDFSLGLAVNQQQRLQVSAENSSQEPLAETEIIVSANNRHLQRQALPKLRAGQRTSLAFPAPGGGQALQARWQRGAELLAQSSWRPTGSVTAAGRPSPSKPFDWPLFSVVLLISILGLLAWMRFYQQGLSARPVAKQRSTRPKRRSEVKNDSALNSKANSKHPNVKQQPKDGQKGGKHPGGRVKSAKQKRGNNKSDNKRRRR